MGFQLILYPLAGIFAAAQAMHSVFRKLKDDQTTLGAEEQLFSFERFNQLVGVEEEICFGGAFRGPSDEDGSIGDPRGRG